MHGIGGSGKPEEGAGGGLEGRDNAGAWQAQERRACQSDEAAHDRGGAPASGPQGRRRVPVPVSRNFQGVALAGERSLCLPSASTVFTRACTREPPPESRLTRSEARRRRRRRSERRTSCRGSWKLCETRRTSPLLAFTSRYVTPNAARAMLARPTHYAVSSSSDAPP